MRHEVAYADEPPGAHRRGDDCARPLEPRVAQRGVRGLGHEVRERLTAAADPRYPRAGDPHLTHRASACPAGSGPVNPYMGGRTVARRRTAPQGGRRGPCDELHELPPARGRRRRGDAELPNEPEEI